MNHPEMRENGELPLLKAATCGPDRAMYVIRNHGMSVTATSAEDNMTLHWVAGIPNTNYLVRYLILSGASTTPEVNIHVESDLTLASHTVGG
ncbi:hypothetical protein EGR_07783 [Echinococcus granulosus]|uniref:Uncharacterized protein n=1 Tax=Echinococcus granulosus TaxID=6210 RepID=W6U896_ECHGR|nr:hypothetical protein EGR_07783 [Echinococcus granulosus]EUB57390.1 hypothetical protein EGR_07783 [Echinococcus granulosus]